MHTWLVDVVFHLIVLSVAPIGEFLIFSECWLLGIIFPQLPPLTFPFFPSWVWSSEYARQVLRAGCSLLKQLRSDAGGEVFLFFCVLPRPRWHLQWHWVHFFKTHYLLPSSRAITLSFTSTWERGTSEIPWWLLWFWFRFFLLTDPTSCFRLIDC